MDNCVKLDLFWYQSPSLSKLNIEGKMKCLMEQNEQFEDLDGITKEITDNIMNAAEETIPKIEKNKP